MAASDIISTLQNGVIALGKLITVLQAGIPISGPTSSALRSYLAGCTLSNDVGTPNTKVDIAAGQFVDSTNTVLLTISSPLVVDFGVVGANGLDTGAIGASTWYHLFGIGQTNGTTACVASTNATTPALPTGYSYYRRLGSVKTNGASQILGFSQFGNEFLWSTSVSDINVVNLGVAAVLYTLSTPPGIKTTARIRAAMSGAAQFCVLTSPDESDAAPSGFHLSLNAVAGYTQAGAFDVRTNASSQIRARADGANRTLVAETYGWIDLRGELS